MSEMTVKVVENDKARLTIKYDVMPESPRDWDNLGTMYTWTRNYYSPDRHNYDSPRHFLEELAREFYHDDNLFYDKRYDMTDEQLLSIIEKHVLIYPVYKYEHGVIAYSMSSFVGRAHHAEWDSGQVGWIFVRKSDVRKEWGVKRISPKLRKKVEDNLRGEVEVYSHYANGDVFGFALEKKVPHWQADDAEKPEDYVFDPDDESTYDLEEVDSCWGFYGWDFKKNGMAEHIPDECRELVNAL